jgi:hypothetical protein
METLIEKIQPLRQPLAGGTSVGLEDDESLAGGLLAAGQSW